MIGYVTLGTNDLAHTTRFYDELLALLGAKRTMETGRYVAWGAGRGTMLLAIKPWDGDPATPGNGTMVARSAHATKAPRGHAAATSTAAISAIRTATSWPSSP